MNTIRDPSPSLTTNSHAAVWEKNSQPLLGQRHAKIAVIKFAHYCLGIHAPYLPSFSLYLHMRVIKIKRYYTGLKFACYFLGIHAPSWLVTYTFSLYTCVIKIKHYYTGFILTVGHRTISGQNCLYYSVRPFTLLVWHLIYSSCMQGNSDPILFTRFRQHTKWL